MTATLHLFTGAVRHGSVTDLRVPAHAQEPVVEVFTRHHAALTTAWNAQGTPPQRQAVYTDALIKTLNATAKKIELYGKQMFPKGIVPASVYTAVIAEILGEGKTDDCIWQHADAQQAFAYMMFARNPRVASSQKPKTAAERNVLFVKQFVLSHKLEEALNAGPTPAQTLTTCTPYQEFVSTVWPKSPLSCDMAVLARRVNNMLGTTATPRASKS